MIFMPEKARSKLFGFLLIILLGGLGGILGCQILLPWLAKFSVFNNIDWIRQGGEGVTIINKTERVVIAENQALSEAIEKTSAAAVGIISQRTEKIVNQKKIFLDKPETIADGSGVVVSSDGLVVTAENLVPESAQKFIVSLGSRRAEAEIRRRDKATGLALMKLNENNFPSLPFAETQPKLGEQLFLIGEKNSSLAAGSVKFIDTGIVNELTPGISVGFLKKDINGSPVFNIKGELVGINLIGADGQIKLVVASLIRDLLK